MCEVVKLRYCTEYYCTSIPYLYDVNFEPRSNTLRSEGRPAAGSRSGRETLLAESSLVRINYRAAALLSYLLFNIDLFKPAKTI